jgi:hypothetical protein
MLAAAEGLQRDASWEYLLLLRRSCEYTCVVGMLVVVATGGGYDNNKRER